jgi:hypothetical protein
MPHLNEQSGPTMARVTGPIANNPASLLGNELCEMTSFYSPIEGNLVMSISPTDLERFFANRWLQGHAFL